MGSIRMPLPVVKNRAALYRRATTPFSASYSKQNYDACPSGIGSGGVRDGAIAGWPRPRQARGHRRPVPDKWPIQSLAVEGNQIFPTAQILAVAGLKIGQVAGKPEFDDARDRLTASGAFETVGYKFVPADAGKGYAATFQVMETTSVFPVQFEELGEPDADIEKLLTAHDPPILHGPPAR